MTQAILVDRKGKIIAVRELPPYLDPIRVIRLGRNKYFAFEYLIKGSDALQFSECELLSLDAESEGTNTGGANS